VSKFYLSLRKSVYLQHNATFLERGASQSRLVPLGEIETRSSKHPSRFEMGQDHLTSETLEIRG
jgi:hypothetical protein